MIAATDYIKAIPDGIRPYVPARFKALGTDGFGRSDYRRKLRAFFEVDRYHVAVAALKALADDQLLPARRVSEAIARYQDRSRAGEPRAKLSRFANSIPKTLARRRSWRGENRSQSSRHRRFQGRADHRNPGQAGRVGQGRAILGDPGVRQGDDGRARAGVRRRRRDSRQDRRQGLDGHRVADAGRGGRRRASSRGADACSRRAGSSARLAPGARRCSLRARAAGESGRRPRQRFRSGGRAQSSGGRLLRRQRRTRRSPSRAGTRHRPDDDLGHRAKRAASRARTSRRR